jgi:hypothetical protein
VNAWRIHVGPCSEATSRYAAGQSCHRCSYLAREARQCASGDEDAWPLSLTVATWRVTVEPAPLLAPRGQGLDWVRRMDIRVTPDVKLKWGGGGRGATEQDFLCRRPQTVFGRGGFRETSGDALSFLFLRTTFDGCIFCVV